MKFPAYCEVKKWNKFALEHPEYKRPASASALQELRANVNGYGRYSTGKITTKK